MDINNALASHKSIIAAVDNDPDANGIRRIAGSAHQWRCQGLQAGFQLGISDQSGQCRLGNGD